MISLTSKERARLRSFGSSLDPIVYVGKDGVTENIVTFLKEALDKHELVKVRFSSFKEDVVPLSRKLEELTDSTFIASTGFTSLFYLQNPDKDKRIYFF